MRQKSEVEYRQKMNGRTKKWTEKQKWRSYHYILNNLHFGQVASLKAAQKK